jgi:hypothetical protein
MRSEIGPFIGDGGTVFGKGVIAPRYIPID